MSSGGHLGFMSITRVAQSCHSGNQARLIFEHFVSAKKHKNFIVLNISRLRTHWSVKWTNSQVSFPKPECVALPISVFKWALSMDQGCMYMLFLAYILI